MGSSISIICCVMHVASKHHIFKRRPSLHVAESLPQLTGAKSALDGHCSLNAFLSMCTHITHHSMITCICAAEYMASSACSCSTGDTSMVWCGACDVMLLSGDMLCMSGMDVLARRRCGDVLPLEAKRWNVGLRCH